MSRFLFVAAALVILSPALSHAGDTPPSPSARFAALVFPPQPKNMTPRLPTILAGSECPTDGGDYSWGHNCQCAGAGEPNECERMCKSDTFSCNGDKSQCECD